MIMESRNSKATEELGSRLARSAGEGDVFCLLGDLGTGKTVFSRGFARGLGINDPVTSPTFTILQVYEKGRLPLYHFDVYRIDDPEEMFEIGFDDYLDGEGVCLIEWADRVEDLLPLKRTEVLIEKDPEQGFDYRKITVTEVGK